jgi:hypothetical protein
MVKLSEDTPESAPDAYWISIKAQGEYNLLPTKEEEESLNRGVYKLRISP